MDILIFGFFNFHAFILENKFRSWAVGAKALLLIGTKEYKTCVHKQGSKSSGWIFAGAGL